MSLITSETQVRNVADQKGKMQSILLVHLINISSIHANFASDIAISNCHF
uniref:Uncharacterized protein n=1 Tax=Arundo donax TaxID=35708 RepID=A0A0A9FLD6_ARUDO